MALPSHLQKNLTPREISFLAENEYISILPRYSMNKIELVGTKIPALKGMRRESVPLWVALILKSQDKCNIVPPEWLNVAYLKESYDQEIRRPTEFSNLPWNWLDISKILLAKAPDDLPDPTNKLRSIIQDLREIRLVKSRKGLRELNESNVQLNGLSLMEITELRPFILNVMNRLRQIHFSSHGKDQEVEGNEAPFNDGYEVSDED